MVGQIPVGMEMKIRMSRTRGEGGRRAARVDRAGLVVEEEARVDQEAVRRAVGAPHR